MKLNLDILLDNLKDWGIDEYTINSDGSIDVHHSVNWSSRKLEELPDLNINKIFGNFSICYNKLTSLKNCPKEIHGNFDCAANLLTSLEHGPQIVTGDYYCEFNKLKSLKGSPKICKTFDCSRNKLKDLNGLPEIISRLDCSHNNLISIKHQSKISGKIYSHGNKKLENRNE